MKYGKDESVGLYEDVAGWLVPEEAQALYKCVKESPGNNVLEIGSYCGRSTCVLAKACKDHGGVVLAYDLFPNSSTYEDGRVVNTLQELWHNLEKYGLSEFVYTIRGDHSNTLPATQGKFGTVFVDGGHEMYDVLLGFKNAYHKLVKGGFLVFHDYGNELFPDVKLTLDVLMAKYDITTESIHPNMIVFKKGKTPE